MITLVAHQLPHSRETEMYRALRGRLLNSGRSVIGMVTPQDHVDIAFAAANLAVSVAQSGRSVALIETNLRQPQLSAQFNLPAAAGLAEVLSQTADDIEVPWQTTEIKNLHLLSAGESGTHPADLLLQPRLGFFLEHVRDLAEIVLLHLPPLAYPESGYLAGQLDGVLLCAQRGRTKRRDLAQAQATLQQANTIVLGAVFIR